MKIEELIILERNQTSKEEIDRIQEILKINLPASYQEFLLKNNGGVAKFANILIKIKVDYFETESYLDKFLNVIEFERVYNLFYNKHKTGIDDFIDNKLVVIAIDNGGDNICISLSEKDFGFVYHWSGDFGATKLANSLEDFIDSLSIDERY